MDVLAEVRNRGKIADTTNDSNKGDVRAGKAPDRGGSTANSNRGDVSAGKEAENGGTTTEKGGLSAKKGSTNIDSSNRSVAWSAVLHQE